MRLVLVDQHGVARSKHVSGAGAIAAMHNGADFSGAIYSLDTGNRVFPPAFVQGGGFGIDEFTGLPRRRGRARSDHVPRAAVGGPHGLDDLRRLLRERHCRCRSTGARSCAPSWRGCARRATGTWPGLEVELYITRLARSGDPVRRDVGQGEPGPAPEVEVFQRGYQFLSDVRLDGIGDTLEAIRDGLWEVGLPPRSIEDEWGPGQIEFTFGPLEGLAAADAMILFRSAVKAICSRRGLLASFMCWPALPNFFPSGWHLHESLVDARVGRQRVRFRHATCCLRSAGTSSPACSSRHRRWRCSPTRRVNAYARFRPYSFAPDRVTWAANNRGTLISIQGAPGDPGTHVENRLGEPAANPYLWLAANIAAGHGRDGARRRAAAHRRRAIPTPSRLRCCHRRSARPSTRSPRARSTGRRSVTRSSTTS